jgi:hypothetical protein
MVAQREKRKKREKEEQTGPVEDHAKKHLFGQQQVLVFKEKEEWKQGCCQILWCCFALQ